MSSLPRFEHNTNGLDTSSNNLQVLPCFYALRQYTHKKSL